MTTLHFKYTSEVPETVAIIYLSNGTSRPVVETDISQGYGFIYEA